MAARNFGWDGMYRIGVFFIAIFTSTQFLVGEIKFGIFSNNIIYLRNIFAGFSFIFLNNYNSLHIALIRSEWSICSRNAWLTSPQCISENSFRCPRRMKVENIKHFIAVWRTWTTKCTGIENIIGRISSFLRLIIKILYKSHELWMHSFYLMPDANIPMILFKLEFGETAEDGKYLRQYGMACVASASTIENPYKPYRYTTTINVPLCDVCIVEHPRCTRAYGHLPRILMSMQTKNMIYWNNNKNNSSGYIRHFIHETQWNNYNGAFEL